MDTNGEYFTSRDEFIENLEEKSDVLRAPELREAFASIDRADFVDPDYKIESYEDYPLPIGFGQTISQPTTVAFMLELLNPQAGDVVLDVGSGSGWTTALLASIVGPDGAVLGLEIIPELVKKGQINLAKYDLPQAEIKDSKNHEALDEAVYDRILVSASANDVPDNLLTELKEGGTMVVPIKESIWKFTKTESGEVESEEFPGFTFVPLV